MNLGVDGTDHDRIGRYAQRIAENRQRQASIRSVLDPALKLAVSLPERQPLAGQPASPDPLGPRDASRKASADARRHRTPADEHLARVPADPPEHLRQALGPPPHEQIGRERWEREARRLEALRIHTGAEQHPAPAAPGLPPSQDRVARAIVRAAGVLRPNS